MKNIKTRVWDKTAKKMIYFKGIFNTRPLTLKSTCPQYADVFELHELSEPMQSLGFPDKNDKEIYEGDIISYGPWSDNSGDCIHEVKWMQETVSFGSFNGHDGPFDSFDICGGEVIGNIHENPELLSINTPGAPA